MRKTISVMAALLATILIVATGRAQPSQPLDILFQVSTLEALLGGVYDGQTTFAMLAKHGDQGLGTFNGLDGEMIAIDGRFYQVRADGKVYEVPPSAKTPFANMVFFRDERRLKIKGPISLAQMEAAIDKILPSRNLFYAIRVSGRFAEVKVRSVPAQKRPYPPLTQVVKHQSVWEYQDILGDLVGFRFPPYVKGLNVVGYHLHFIDVPRKKGGHLLDATVTDVTVMVDYLYGMDLKLPRKGDFLSKGLGADTSGAVRAVEK